MNRFQKHQRRFLLMIVCLTFLSLSITSFEHPNNIAQNQHTLSQDTLRPDINEWGIDGTVGTVDSFTVWANVTDSNSGVLNVSTTIRKSANTSTITRTLMTFNGTYYTCTIQPLEVNHTYTIWITAYDNSLNVAQSFNRQFDLFIYPNTDVDPSVTFPFVMIGSFITLVVVVLVARTYHIRNPRIDLSSNGTELPEIEATEDETS